MTEWFDDQNFYGPFDLDWWTKPLPMRPGARVTMGSFRIHESLMEVLMANPAHFSLEEFLASDTANSIGASNFPTWDVVDNLHRVADAMERIRAGLGAQPVTILSGYRSPPVNDAVGGADNSAHLFGLACDFVVPDFGSPLDICLAIQPYMVVLEIDQLIWEFGDWVHLGLTDGQPRHQALTIDNNGTREGFA